MAIKVGVPLEQADILDATQLRIAKALSVTTVEELAGLLLTAGDDVGSLLEGADLPQLAQQAMKMSSYSVTDDLERAREASEDRGTGALPPSQYDAERLSELFVDDVDLHPGDTSDKPEVFLESCLGPVRDQGRRGWRCSPRCCRGAGMSGGAPSRRPTICRAVSADGSSGRRGRQRRRLRDRRRHERSGYGLEHHRDRIGAEAHVLNTWGGPACAPPAPPAPPVPSPRPEPAGRRRWLSAEVFGVATDTRKQTVLDVCTRCSPRK